MTPAPDHVRPARQRPRARGDHGSVSPLVIGMTLCLLVLGVGIIAAGSAVLARRNLQSVCDGAAIAVAGGISVDRLTDADLANARGTLERYLARRAPDVAAIPGHTATAVTLQCSTTTRIAFGALFGQPTLPISVRAQSQLVRR